MDLASRFLTPFLLLVRLQWASVNIKGLIRVVMIYLVMNSAYTIPDYL